MPTYKQGLLMALLHPVHVDDYHHRTLESLEGVDRGEFQALPVDLQGARNVHQRQIADVSCVGKGGVHQTPRRQDHDVFNRHPVGAADGPGCP